MKSVAAKCFKEEPPTIDDWAGVVYDIYVIEEISYRLGVKNKRSKESGLNGMST